jgi:hypothetical protein
MEERAKRPMSNSTRDREPSVPAQAHRDVDDRDSSLMTWAVENRKGERIESVEDWRVLGAPASAKHWKDGRSAKELAKAWISGAGLTDLARLLDTNDRTRGFSITSATAEAQVAFDQFPGGKRNHDLLLRGRATAGELVIGLEAKADESFGESVTQYRAAGQLKREKGESTNAPERLDNLIRDLTAGSLSKTPGLADLRYQLFSGIAGTLAAVKSDEAAAFVVHEFATKLTNPGKRRANRLAFARFTMDVLGATAPDEDWWLLGPFHVPTARWAHIPLYVGHLTTGGGSTRAEPA